MYKIPSFLSLYCIVLLVLCFACSAEAQNATKAVNQDTSEGNEKLIVFMVAEREYKTIESLKSFADSYVLPWSINANVQFTFVVPDAENPNKFHGIEKLKEADLLVLSVRRRTLPTEDFAILHAYLDAGKPLIAIRTASHAFHLRNKAPAAGHDEWPSFDADILGHEYEGHFDKKLLPKISRTTASQAHALMQDVTDLPFVSSGSLYQARALASTAEVLLEGSIIDKGEQYTEPVAWTNQLGDQRIFYTSLGHPDDFKEPAFLQMMHNAVRWTLER
ncbi:MAG: ThuA domain-containing protein [Rhodothermales bacterium]